MATSFRVAVIGIGGAGRQAARCFPNIDDHHVKKVHIDTLEAFNKDPNKDIESETLLFLQNEDSPAGHPKTSASISQTFGTIRTKLSSTLSVTDGVILFAGLGGKTGGSIAPLVARHIADSNIPVISQVYLPWALEGAVISRRSQKNLDRLLPHCVYTSVINNDKVSDVVPPETSLSRLLSVKAALQAWHAIDVLRVIRAI